jgi:hypothetical protein
MPYPHPPLPFNPSDGTPPTDAGLAPQVATVPLPPGLEVEKTHNDAARALQGEQHVPLGLLDTLQTMFMWQESPSERVDKNRALGIDPPSLPKLPPAVPPEDVKVES